MKTYKNSFLFFYLFFSAFSLHTSTVAYAQQVKTEDSLAFYRAMVSKPKNSSDLTNAYAFFKQRSEQSFKKNDTLNIVYDLRYIALIQFKLGLLKESEKTAVAALSFVDNLKINNAITDESRMGLNNHIGIVYKRLGDYSSALKYFKAALKLKPTPENINSIQNNMGLIYYEQADYQKALDEFAEVHQTNLRSNNTQKTARSLSNIGMTLSQMKRSEGLDSLTKALQLRTSIDYKNGIIDSYLKLAEYYQDRGDFSYANSYANKADQLAISYGNKPQELEALSLLMQLNPNENVQRYTKLVDSLNKADLTIQNSYAAKKYALEKQERLVKENQLKLTTIELDNERQKLLKTSYLFIGILILLAAIFALVYLRSKHKKEKLQGVYDTESRISKKIHDEVANDVFQLMTKLEHEDEVQTDVINDLHSLYYRTREISKEHSTLNSDYPFLDYLKELIENFHDSQTNIVVKGLSDISWSVLPEIQKTTIYKVIQELLINMKKHSQASIVVLVFQKENRKLNISYSDNGIGSDLKRGSGLQNTENRIQAINGTITFDTELEKGFKVKISI